MSLRSWVHRVHCCSPDRYSVVHHFPKRQTNSAVICHGDMGSCSWAYGRAMVGCRGIPKRKSFSNAGPFQRVFRDLHWSFRSVPWGSHVASGALQRGLMGISASFRRYQDISGVFQRDSLGLKGASGDFRSVSGGSLRLHF